jgi:tetratricopeptide (TPR) repeat protein
LAGVFLSYDRDDTDKARLFAAALEKSGHSVWWDLHVRGGAQFSKVIEEALAAADVVVVLWSANSVESAWVRDEAGVGRDSGRLVPVTIDGTKAPLGFRQFQTIDLSGWNGRGKPTQLKALLSDVEMLAKDERHVSKTIAAPLTTTRAARGSVSVGRAWAIAAIIILIAGLLIFLLGIFIARPWARGTSSLSTVEISASDTSFTSRDFARDLLAQLGQFQSSRPDALQLISPGAEKRATLHLEVGGKTEGSQIRASLVLFDGDTQGLLWSNAIERPVEQVSDLRQQLGYTAAQVLQCTAEARPDGQAIMPATSLKLYLNGCAAYTDKTPENLHSLVSQFDQLTVAEPRFADGWAKLLLVESEYTRMIYVPEASAILARLPHHVAAARALDPNMPEALLAEAMSLPDQAFQQRISLLQRAVEIDPENAPVLSFFSDQLRFVGRINESVAAAQQAVQADPLSPTIRNGLVEQLTYAGKTDAALSEVKRLEQIWPGASNVRFARFVVNLRYGDPNEALRSIQSGEVSTAQTPYVESFLRARADPTAANVDRAIEDALSWYEKAPTTIYHLVQVLGAFHRNDQLISILLNWSHPDKVTYVLDGLFRPAIRPAFRDPRMIAVAKRLGVLGYWQKTGKWPDFCSDPDLPYDCKKEAAKLNA